MAQPFLLAHSVRSLVLVVLVFLSYPPEALVQAECRGGTKSEYTCCTFDCDMCWKTTDCSTFTTKDECGDGPERKHCYWVNPTEGYCGGGTYSACAQGHCFTYSCTNIDTKKRCNLPTYSECHWVGGTGGASTAEGFGGGDDDSVSGGAIAAVVVVILLILVGGTVCIVCCCCSSTKDSSPTTENKTTDEEQPQNLPVLEAAPSPIATNVAVPRQVVLTTISPDGTRTQTTNATTTYTYPDGHKQVRVVNMNC